jgi:integrase
MSKTKDTKISYYNRSCSLMIKAYNEALIKDSKFAEKKMFLKYKGKKHIMMDIRYAVVWAVKNWSSELRHSSWKYYRCSLIYTAELLYLKKALSREDFEKIQNLLRKVKGLDKKTISVDRTSSGKKKSFNIKEIGQIDGELISSKNKWSNPLRIWIRAAKYTGLRPVEWKSVSYDADNNELVVKNAKHTNGRSFGKTRTISLKHLEQYKIEDIKLHIKISDAMLTSGNWEEYYKGCSNLLRYSARKIWTNKAKYPTLYSCRHQFSADMKASGCTKREVAALMGHASDLTAQEHYGRKKHGVSGKKPEVSKNDLKMVKSGDKKEFKFENKND